MKIYIINNMGLTLSKSDFFKKYFLDPTDNENELEIEDILLLGCQDYLENGLLQDIQHKNTNFYNNLRYRLQRKIV